MSDDSEERLRPARPEPRGKRPEYAPKIPWKWIILGVAAATILGGGYWWRQDSQEQELRSQIVQAYDGQLAPVAERYRSFRSKLEGFIMEAADNDPPEDYVDERLRISNLHSAQGLYMRLGAHQADTPESIEAAARDLRTDAIGRCLGITPISLKGFYEDGAFLMPGWADEVRSGEAGLARLRVLDDDLARRSDRDLPNLLNAIRSEYFLLVIQQGQSRSDAPVDVYMWDLRRDELLLRTRTQSTGMLVPVRLAFEGVDVPRTAPLRESLIQHDCSIAAQVKELAGEPAMEFGSQMPSNEAGAADAGADDAGAAPDGGTREE